MINGLCLDTQGGGTQRTTPTVLAACDGSASQMRTTGPDYSLVNRASNMCLEDPGADTAHGTQLQIWPRNGRTKQKWRLPAV